MTQHVIHNRLYPSTEARRIDAVGSVLIETMIGGYGLTVEDVAASIGVSPLAIERYRRRAHRRVRRNERGPKPEAA